MNDSPEMLLCLLGLPHHIPACRQNSLYGRAVLLGGNIRRFRGDAVDGQLLQVGVGQHQRALAVKGDCRSGCRLPRTASRFRTGRQGS